MVQTDDQTVRPSAGRPGVRWSMWIGWPACVLLAAFFALGGVMNLLRPPFVVEGAATMGLDADALAPLGVVVLVSVLLYLIPRTSVIGCILLTGYLGGAVAVHVVNKDPLFPETLLPTLFGAALWLAIIVRQPRVRSIVLNASARDAAHSAPRGSK